MADDDYNEVDDLGYPLFLSPPLSVSYACTRSRSISKGSVFSSKNCKLLREIRLVIVNIETCPLAYSMNFFCFN